MVRFHCIAINRIAVSSLLVSLLLLSSLASAQNLPHVGASKNDLMCKERYFDFGTVPIGQQPTHRFKITNCFDEPITAKDVAASCGCSIAKVEPKTIEPGGTAELIVQLNTASFRGKKTSSIEVRFSSDAPKPDDDSVVDLRLDFSISANIDPISVTPKAVDYPRDSNEKLVKNVVVSRAGSPYWKLKNIKTSTDAVEASIESREVSRDHVAYTIRCVYHNPKDQIEHSPQEFLTMETNDSFMPKFEIPIRFLSASEDFSVAKKEVQLVAPTWSLNTIVASKIPTTLADVEYDSELIDISFEKSEKPKKAHILEISRSAKAAATDQTTEPIIVLVKSSDGQVCQFQVEVR